MWLGYWSFSFLFFSFPLLLVQGLIDGAPAGERRMEGGGEESLILHINVFMTRSREMSSAITSTCGVWRGRTVMRFHH